MPELLTKYPDVTLEVLSGAGARCAAGGPQRILKECPPERFCSLPTGELCVYGLPEISKMTQISEKDLAAIVCRPQAKPSAMGMIPGEELGAVALALAVGFVLGRVRIRR